MSLQFYSIFHLVAILVLTLSLGGLWGFYAGIKSSPHLKASAWIRSFLLSLHGLSSLFIFIAGFGLIAKLKIPWPWPWWIYVKLILWLFLSLSPFIIRKAYSIKSKKLYGLLLLILMLILLLPVFIVRLKS